MKGDFFLQAFNIYRQSRLGALQQVEAEMKRLANQGDAIVRELQRLNEAPPKPAPLAQAFLLGVTPTLAPGDSYGPLPATATARGWRPGAAPRSGGVFDGYSDVVRVVRSREALELRPQRSLIGARVLCVYDPERLRVLHILVGGAVATVGVGWADCGDIDPATLVSVIFERVDQ